MKLEQGPVRADRSGYQVPQRRLGPPSRAGEPLAGRRPVKKRVGQIRARGAHRGGLGRAGFVPADGFAHAPGVDNLQATALPPEDGPSSTEITRLAAAVTGRSEERRVGAAVLCGPDLDQPRVKSLRVRAGTGEGVRRLR